MSFSQSTGNPIVFVYDSSWNTTKSLSLQLNEQGSGRSFPWSSSKSGGIFPSDNASTMETSAIIWNLNSTTIANGTTHWIAAKFSN